MRNSRKESKFRPSKQVRQAVNEDVDNARHGTSPRAALAVSSRLVYGEIGDQFVFIPEPRARFLVQVWRALLTATTWEDLKRLAPPPAYRQIRKYNRQVLGRDASELRADAPFHYDEMTGVADGDYPGWPAQEMSRWMPRDIQRDFGDSDYSYVSGEFLQLDRKHTRAIVQRLRQAGFQCRRNQHLIEQAHGD
jgi:hypothetical protein